MTFSKFGRFLTALVATAALGLGMTACGGGTIGYIWVTSSYYNQINGYKIDDYTGNLTAILDQPFADQGTNPATIVLKGGGRFVYVINTGTGEINTPNSGNAGATYTPPAGAGISEYSVGGSGVLTPERTFFSQGFHPVWATFDSTGNFLYVVDKYSPAYCAPVAPATSCKDFNLTGSLAPLPADLNGSITAFSVAADTGRLSLVQNTAILKNNVPQNYFEVGQNPGMTQSSGSCLYTLSPSTIYPYSVNSSNGQLTVVTTGSYVFNAPSGGVTPVLTSINTNNASFTYLTDTANNMIYSLMSSGSCTLTPIANSQATNVMGTSNPVNSVTSSNGQFLYVINQDFSPTLSGPPIANSTISAFNINGNGQISTLANSATTNPYPVGSGPVCVAIDPTHQYLYTSNGNDGTITGKVIRQDRGFLSDLSRGSVFPLGKNPTCLVISGSVY